MVAGPDIKGVLRLGFGQWTTHHPLPRPRRKRVVRTVKVCQIQLAPRKRTQVLIHLDNTDEPIEIALDVVEQSGIHVGDEVTTEILKLLREDDMRWRVRQAALHLLSYRPRTEHELRIRLHAKGFHDNFVESCLRLLENQGLLNDHAFALAHVRSRIRFHVRGRVRLSQELRQKGVSTKIANRAIDEVFNDEETSEEELACDAARQWISRQNQSSRNALVSTDPEANGQKVRRRLYAFLSRRGFRSDAVRAGLTEAEARARNSLDE